MQKQKTTRRTSSEEERELIESIAQARVKYENILNDQCAELRKDPDRFHLAVTKLNETPLVAKPGQTWVPTQDMVDEYLAKCDELCLVVPKTFDEFSLFFFHGVYYPSSTLFYFIFNFFFFPPF